MATEPPNRRRKKTKRPPTPRERAQRALRELRELALTIARERGMTRAEAEALDHFTIPLTVPLDASAGRRDVDQDLPALLHSAVETQIIALQRAAYAFRPGHVYSYLDRAADGDASRPQHPEQTFAGYSAHGRPKWISFTNLCLQRGEDRVDGLYKSPPEIIAIAQEGKELNGELFLPPDDADLSYRIRGQVVTGLIPQSLNLEDRDGPRIALTLQIVEIRSGQAPLRLRANLIGLSREDILQAALSGQGRDAAERLRKLLNATERRLKAIARRTNHHERRGKASGLDELLPPMLRGLRGELERCFRPQRRRTRHARARHRSGQRPTSDAMHDAVRARDEHLFADTSRGTFIALGPKRRAHVFSAAGKHVTSLRLEPGELERKIERKRWCLLDEAARQTFRRRIGVDNNTDPEEEQRLEG